MEYGPVPNGSLIAGAEPLGSAAALPYRINLDFERASPWPKSEHITRPSRVRTCTMTTTSARKVTTLRATIAAAARADTRSVTIAGACSDRRGCGSLPHPHCRKSARN